MSSRATVIPGIDKSILRQHVVRIRCVQSLQPRLRANWTESGKKISPEMEESARKVGQDKQDHVSYVVIQKRILRGKEGPWKIWGLLKASDPDKAVGKPGKRAPHIAIPER